jgi:type VI secretion system secreted protein VgrG
MAKFKQGHRELSIDTPLGADVLLLTAFTGREALSEPFEYELAMLSEKPDINFSDILGKNVSVSVSLQPGSLSAASSIRYFNGYISRFEQTHSEGNIYHYSATMVPWLWFLTRRRDCRIFQNQTVPQIVQQVFSDLGFSSVVDNALTASYRTRDYCVQYRETDFDFVSRLLEDEGIYYFFKHEKDSQSGDVTHKLVLADGASASVAIMGDSTISYLGPDRTGKGEYIRDWKLRQTLQSGNFMLNDYDFTAPKKSLLVSAANTSGVVSQTDHRVYDYPGGYTQSSDGGNYVQARMQEQQAGFAVATASTNNRGIEAGYVFTLADHPVSAMNQTYLTKSVRYDIRNENYLQSQPGNVETTFSAHLTCFESSQQFRPARVTPKALVRGPQTAVVVGPSGEKIYTDEYGRVKAQFYWDTYGTSDQNSSCWIRVSQSWAGAPNNGLNWGDMALPHVGDEVIVDFLEGDPDKPLITGRVYNADNMPPLALPANKDRRIMQDDYGNRIIFDATPGSEHLRLYSPHHHSGLALGTSSKNWTWSDIYTFCAGENITGTAGAMFTLVAGANVAATVGVNAAFLAGVNLGISLGPQFTIGVGAVNTITAGGATDIHLNTRHEVAKKDIVEVGTTGVCLAAGTGTAAGSSILNLTPTDLELSVGPVVSVANVETAGWMKAAGIIAAVAAAVPVAALTTTAVMEIVQQRQAGDFTTSGSTATDTTSLQPDGLAAAEDALAIASAVGMAVSLVALIVYQAGLATVKDDLKAINHKAQKTGDASIELESGTAGGTVLVTAKKTFIVGTPTHAPTTKYIDVNFANKAVLVSDGQAKIDVSSGNVKVTTTGTFSANKAIQVIP